MAAISIILCKTNILFLATTSQIIRVAKRSLKKNVDVGEHFVLVKAGFH